MVKRTYPTRKIAIAPSVVIAKVDKNQKEIVDALRKVGASVCLLHTVGKGTPDILVGYQGKNILMEIKSQRGRLTQCQKNFHATWQGDAVKVVRSIEQALNAVGIPITLKG